MAGPGDLIVAAVESAIVSSANWVDGTERSRSVGTGDVPVQCSGRNPCFLRSAEGIEGVIGVLNGIGDGQVCPGDSRARRSAIKPWRCYRDSLRE